MRVAALVSSFLAFFAGAPVGATPFLDDFATDTTGSYTMFDAYGAGSSTLSYQPGVARLTSQNETVEYFYPNGVTRGPAESVSLDVDAVSLTGGPGWRGTGLVLSSSATTGIFGSNYYRYSLDGDTASGNYGLKVQSNANAVIFTSPGFTYTAPINLSIVP